MPQHRRSSHLHNPERKQLDDPNPILPSGRIASTRHRKSKESQEEGSKVHDLDWYPIQKRFLHALLEVRQREGSQIYSGGDPWKDLRRSCRLEILDHQSYLNGLLLIFPAEGCKRVHQEVRQMLEVWKYSTHTVWETDDDNLPMVFCSVGSWHCWPITPR